MQWAVVTKLLARLLAAVGIAMASAIPWAWIYDGPDVRNAFIISTAILLVTAAVAWFRGKEPESIFPREAMATVAFGWFTVGLFGALPYVLTGVVDHPVAAFFESVSGFSTTGATVFSDVESLPRAVNWWRTLTQWLGGMGIVVLFIAILPRLGVGAKHLFRSEVPGPITSDLRPKLRETAASLWKIYVGLTATEATLLWAAGMSPFDAVCHSFATLATGGFSTRNASIGAYGSVTIEMIVVVFMLLAAGMMFFIRKLNRTVTYQPTDAVGKTATVYLSIPKRGEGAGQVNVTVSGRRMVMNAISTDILMKTMM